MAVCKEVFLFDNNRGASMLEVLLAMAIVAMAMPVVYSQMNKVNESLRDMLDARKIIDSRDDVLNFVRLNQGSWPDVAQIRLADEELDAISELPKAGFIDKYFVNGATVTDVYLAFDLGKTKIRTNRIAKNIGTDAAVVGIDGIAYGDSWAVAAPDFKEGDLIYRISKNIIGEDKSKFLHRTEMGEENLNTMLRDLNMAGNKILDVGGIDAKSARINNVSTSFIEVGSLLSDNIYFSSGANLYADNAAFGALRVTGDITGFRNIYVDTLNGKNYTPNGRIIADRATIYNSINIANNSVRTLENSMRELNTAGGSLSNTFKNIFSYALGGSGIYLALNSMREAINTTISLDDSLRDLKRVTSLANSEYSKFMQTANQTAIALGTTTSGAIDATTRFSQLGYSFDEASDSLSKYALILSNVANMSATDSSSAIVSVLKGFQMETSDVASIVDTINEAG